MILIHRLSDNWRSSLPLLAELPAYMPLIAISLRGHRDSGKSAPRYSLADMAGDLLTVADALGGACADTANEPQGFLDVLHLGSQDRPAAARSTLGCE